METPSRLPASFLELRAEFQRQGFFEPKAPRVIGEFLFHIVVCLGGLVLVVQGSSLLVKAVGLIVSTAGLLGISTNAHTSSHQATTSHRRVNKLLALVGYPFFLQVSESYWHHKHIVVHHPVPNVLDVDNDIDLAPWFAITEARYEAAGPLLKKWYDVQWVLFPLAILVNGFGVQIKGWKFLIRKLLSSRERRTDHWFDLAAMLAHIACWILLPMWVWGAGPALSLYVIRIMLMGYAMFIAFAPAHYPEEAACVSAANKDADFVLLQCANTINFKTGPVGRLLCSGVDFQIEHHLFPTVSHVHYPRMSPRLREFCVRMGYPYRVLPWWLAVWKSLSIMRVRKRVLSDVHDLRSGVQA